MPNAQLPFFVYGTLRPGFHNYKSFLSGSTTQEISATIDGFLMYSNFGHFPFIVESPLGMSGTIAGDLIWVDEDSYDAVLGGVDMLEGFVAPGASSNLYDREVLTVTTSDGLDVEAYVYITASNMVTQVTSNLDRVENGDWAAVSNK